MHYEKTENEPTKISAQSHKSKKNQHFFNKVFDKIITT